MISDMRKTSCRVVRDNNDPQKRLVLTLGDRAWHISDDEAKSLKSSLTKYKV